METEEIIQVTFEIVLLHALFFLEESLLVAQMCHQQLVLLQALGR